MILENAGSIAGRRGLSRRVAMVSAAALAFGLAARSRVMGQGRPENSEELTPGLIDPARLDQVAELTFSDEFDTLSLWDGKSGTWNTADAWDNPRGFTLPGNGEQQWYINSRFAQTQDVRPWKVADGRLSLIADHMPAKLKPILDNQPYSSGQLTTYHSFGQLYGYFEVRARMPKGKGLWPAFWMLPVDRSWPPEIDVVEYLGHTPTTLFATAHMPQPAPGDKSGAAIEVSDMSADFHIYSVDWQKDFITWYFDRKPVFKIKTPESLHKPMYLLLSLAVGGYWPGSPDASTQFPAQFQVDYVKAYRARS